jgi:signal transduction histidine kinase
MNHLKYQKKMGLMALVVALPLGALLYLLISETNVRIDFAEKERTGAEYNESIMKLFRDIQQHRGMANAFLRGDPSFKEKLIIKQANIAEDIRSVDAFEMKTGTTLGPADIWQTVKEKWQVIEIQAFRMQAKVSFDMHTALIHDILGLMAHMADISNLTIDPDIETSYLIDILVNKLPLAIEYTGQLRGLGVGALVQEKFTPQEKAHLIVLSGLSRSTLEEIKSNLSKAFQENSHFKTHLKSHVQNCITASHNAFQTLDSRIIYAPDISIQPSEYFDTFTDAINMSLTLHDAVTSELSTLLQARTERLTRKKDCILLFSLLSLVVLLYLFVGNYFSVMNSLSSLVHASRQIGGGDLHARVSLEAKDETAMVAKSFNEMAKSLATSTAELKAANEALQSEITERKKTEKKLAQAVTELENSNAELEQFASIVSHDLQAPIITVSSYLKLLQGRYQGKLDPESEQFMQESTDTTIRMQTLIRDLLEYSRVGARVKPFEEVDCNEIMKQVLANLQATLQETVAEVTYDPLPVAMADATQITQLIQNLISNAIKFRGDEPPYIHISAERKEKEWIFSFSDNGIGIPPKDIEHIFDIFHRLHGKTEYPGSGIGLATCKKVVERHSGHIWVKSEPGKGSTFFFSIPDREIID